MGYSDCLFAGILKQISQIYHMMISLWQATFIQTTFCLLWQPKGKIWTKIFKKLLRNHFVKNLLLRSHMTHKVFINVLNISLNKKTVFISLITLIGCSDNLKFPLTVCVNADVLDVLKRESFRSNGHSVFIEVETI